MNSTYIICTCCRSYCWIWRRWKIGKTQRGCCPWTRTRRSNFWFQRRNHEYTFSFCSSCGWYYYQTPSPTTKPKTNAPSPLTVSPILHTLPSNAIPTILRTPSPTILLITQPPTQTPTTTTRMEII